MSSSGLMDSNHAEAVAAVDDPFSAACRSAGAVGERTGRLYAVECCPGKCDGSGYDDSGDHPGDAGGGGTADGEHIVYPDARRW